MPTTLASERPARHRLLPETAERMVKAEVRKAETEAFRAKFGAAVERVRMLSGLLLKQFADAIQRDERQVARWIAGTERPQWDAICAVPAFRPLVVVAIAELAGGSVELETVVRVKREIA